MSDSCTVCGRQYHQKLTPDEQYDAFPKGKIEVCNGDPYTYIHYPGF